jgi:hypothetical protein
MAMIHHVLSIVQIFRECQAPWYIFFKKFIKVLLNTSRYSCMAKKLKGSITISRPSCSSGEEFITVEVEDRISGCTILKAYIDLAEFSRAITGLGYVKCELDYFSQAPVGKKREVKTEFVPFEHHYSKDKKKEEARKLEAVKPFEVDGWKHHYLDDLGNHHRSATKEGVRGYNIGFIRFVETEDEKVISD